MIKSGYSFAAAVGSIKDVVSRLKEIGWDTFPMADRSSTFGFVEATKACEESGLRPVYGVELAVVPQHGNRRPIIDHWTVLATSSLRPLHDLIHKATEHAACLTYDQIQECDESLVLVAGERCLVPLVDARRVHIGLSPATPMALRRQAAQRGMREVAVPNNFFPRETDLELYRIMLGPNKSTTQTYPMHITSDDEFRRAVPRADAAIEFRKEVLAGCRAKLLKAELLKPKHDKTLEQMCVEGAARLGIDISVDIYASRLRRELDMIAEKNFDDYFYIIAELVEFAKARMVVGPARGSSCGSLVCYLTGVTAIDPLRHDLLFERFIDVTRADLPDVDLDFSQAHRDLVFEHAADLYGDRVARLGSVGTFDTRSALRQIAVPLCIPDSVIDAVAETAIKRSMGDSRKGSSIADTLDETDAGRRMVKEYPESRIVGRMEGHPHNAGKHAAGLVATSTPVIDYVAIDARNDVAMCDKYDAEYLNLLKIDILGLTQLTIFERAMELIGVPPLSGWHEKLPLDDPAAFEVLNQGKFCGVFQFEGNSMRSLAREIRFESLDDIIAAVALVRPGPMNSGQTDEWVARRTGRRPIKHAHPILEPYLKETLGIVIYQENVLNIGREVGDLSWADVTALRKAMSKSLGREYFDQFGDKWKAAAMAKGLPEDVAKKFWDDMCQFGAWAFNKSHSVGYAYVAYWCCWWKAHHPVEYACAVLDMLDDPLKQINILRELRMEGVDYIPVDPERSTDRWTPLPGGKKLLGPLSNIKGVGPVKMREVLAARRTGRELTPGLAALMANPRTPIDSLTPIKDFIKALGDEFKKTVVSPVTDIPEAENGTDGVVIVATPSRILPKDENEPAKLAKRGGQRLHPSKSLILYVRDDQGELLAKIDRLDYERLGVDVLERGKAGKAIYAMKGSMMPRFRMMYIKGIRHLGDLS